MAVLFLVPLLVLPIFLLGLLVWTIFKHFFIIEVPSALKHPVKFRILDCLIEYAVTLPTKVGGDQRRNRYRKSPHAPIVAAFPELVDEMLGTSHGTPRVCSCVADFYHNVCSFLARETDSVLLAVGYRKFPQYHYPVIADDCLNASIHFPRTLKTYGVDPSRVVVCGDSTGGAAVTHITQVLLGQTDLPQIRAQILIYPIVQSINFQLPSTQQYQNVPFLTQDFLMMCLCKYMAIDPSWKDAILKGVYIPPDVWKKYRKWLSYDNIPKSFKNKYREPHFPGPFNEAAYLEMKHLFVVENQSLLADDEIIAQLPEAFLVSCESDVLRDHTLLYKKRLEDQGVPVSWYHVKDGFHGCINLFDRKPFSFPCSQKILDAVVSYINSI
ncbi:arylacetamide deacetylase-like 4 [Fukomys damarensis]|uniref:arylacetamide deacetylase-like 4 n=1 Tax=Fukomys damarensis TaxID=885580 RepID=UPI00053F9501|nr:arylacetamide deacetylase-like 4 [Fukomys damarensis]